MNDSQQFEIFKFPQTIGLVICLMPAKIEGGGRLDDIERDPSQANPGETVNIGLVDGQVTKGSAKVRHYFQISSQT